MCYTSVSENEFLVLKMILMGSKFEYTSKRELGLYLKTHTQPSGNGTILLLTSKG